MIVFNLYSLTKDKYDGHGDTVITTFTLELVIYWWLMLRTMVSVGVLEKWEIKNTLSDLPFPRKAMLFVVCP